MASFSLACRRCQRHPPSRCRRAARLAPYLGLAVQQVRKGAGGSQRRASDSRCSRRLLRLESSSNAIKGKLEPATSRLRVQRVTAELALTNHEPPPEDPASTAGPREGPKA